MTRTQQIILDDLELRLRERIVNATAEFKDRSEEADISDKHATLSVLTIYSYFLTTFAIKVLGVEPTDVARLVYDAAKLMQRHREEAKGHD